MKPARNNYAFIDSQKMKKAAVRDSFHLLSPAHSLILNFTNGFSGWGAELASISASTALTIWKSEPKA